MTDARLPGSGRRRRRTARLAAGVAVLSLGLAGVTAAGRGDFTRAAADLNAVTAAVPQDPVAKQLKELVEAQAKSK